MFEVAFVNSTAIRLVAYERSERVLRIVFNNNSGYDYEGIDEEIFELLASSQSVGREFNRMRSLPYQKLSSSQVMDFLMEALKQSSRVLVQV